MSSSADSAASRLGLGPTAAALISGTAGGVAQVVVGHPFNTIKARLQSAPPQAFSSALDCLRKTVSSEGPLAVYKGVVPPLVGVGAINAALFFANGFFLRYVGGAADLRDPSDVPLARIALCGALAGVSQVIVASPIELVMIRLQVQRSSSASSSAPLSYSGPLDCVRKILRTGGVRALYRGAFATAMREIPNYSGYMFGYEGTRRALLKKGESVRDLDMSRLFIAGGVGGMCAQLSSLPCDVIKTKIQTLGDDANVSVLKMYREVWKKQGIKGFYTGLGPVITRAIPANGATFLAYEMTMRTILQ